MASYAEGKEKGYRWAEAGRSSALTRARSKLKRGFWGDIVQSPYWSIGVHADEHSFQPVQEAKLPAHQDLPACRRVQHLLVALRAVNQETLQGQPCSLSIERYLTSLRCRRKTQRYTEGASGRASHTGLLPPSLLYRLRIRRDVEKIEEEGEIETLQDDRLDTLSAGQARGNSSKKVPQGVRLILLQGENFDFMKGKKKFAELFDVVFLSNLCLQMLKEPLPDLLRARAALVVEGADFMLNFDKNDRKAFNDKIKELGKELGMVVEDGKRDRYKLYNGVHFPLYFLSFDKAAAQEVLAQRAKRQEEAVKSQASLESLLSQSTGDERPTAEALEGLEALDVPDRPYEVDAMNRPVVYDGIRRGWERRTMVVLGRKGTAAAPALKAGPLGFCAVTGLPAKYKDPQTGLAYANVEAFKEIRRRHGARETPGEAQETDPAVAAQADEEKRDEVAGERREAGKEEEEEEIVEPLIFQNRPKWRLGGSAVL
eukprot:766873-Hanusia_phi.AAC.5